MEKNWSDSTATFQHKHRSQLYIGVAASFKVFETAPSFYSKLAIDNFILDFFDYMSFDFIYITSA